MNANHRGLRMRKHQSGLSLIELMVGAAIALSIAAAASALLVSQLRYTRALMLETRLTQELRSACELIARDLRRAGYTGHAGTAANPYAYGAVAAGDTADIRYSMDASENDRVDDNEQFGFRLRNDAIEMQLGRGNWQSVTDATVVRITAFGVTPLVNETAIVAPCPTRLQSRSVAIDITAALAGDPQVTRSVRTVTHVRADSIAATCPA